LLRSNRSRDQRADTETDQRTSHGATIAMVMMVATPVVVVVPVRARCRRSE
jgi:hypothetical protein